MTENSETWMLLVEKLPFGRQAPIAASTGAVFVMGTPTKAANTHVVGCAFSISFSIVD
jgi:hypothetical protein